MPSDNRVSVHLYGGALCGHTELNVPADAHALTWASLPGTVYSYCPHASATLSAQRGQPTTVFLASTISHDAFDSSLQEGNPN